MSKHFTDVSRAVVPLIEDSSISRAATSVAVTLGENTVQWQAGTLPITGEVVPNSVMYAASVTKQLTATLVALAVESGALGYESAVSVYLPELPDWMRTVRVRHLLHHTSAVPEVAGEVGNNLDNARVLHRVQRCPPPERPPGTAFAYSNTGYVLLAAAIEARFQEPFPELVRRRIFAPLNLVDSTLGGPPPVSLPGEPDPPATVGDGGWWTSSVDLDRWLVALNNASGGATIRGTGLNARLLETLQTPGRLDDDSPLDYAWGMRLTWLEGHRTLTHGGSWPGWSSKTLRQPDRGLAVCVLSTASDERAVSGLVVDLARRL
jgi:CubicO group peptidase (beta-lactamase class C family)